MMKGLILKDLYTLKQQGKIYLVMVALFASVAFFSKDSSFLVGFVCVMVTMLPVTALSYDERAGWDKYALAMPLRRRDIVLGKYVLSGIAATLGFVMAFLFTLITGNGLGKSAFMACAFSLISIFLLSVLMPVFIKFGVEKGRMIMMAVLFIPVGIIMLANALHLPLPSDDQLSSLKFILPVVVVAGVFLSGWLSLKIYEKKEF